MSLVQTKPSRPTMFAVIYCRFSPRPDADTSESNERQRLLCREWCRNHFYRVRGEFKDDALSGKGGGAEVHRDGLWAAISALQPGDVFLVYKLDRLARDVYLSHLLDRRVRSRGCRIVSVVGEGTSAAGQVQWDDRSEDKLIRNILVSLDQYNREVSGARTSAVMRRHIREGRNMGGIPYGKMVDPKSELNQHGRPGRLIDCPEELATLRTIKNMVAQGVGIRMIARRLNQMGKLNRRGKPWHHTTIGRICAANGLEVVNHKIVKASPSVAEDSCPPAIQPALSSD